MPDKYELIRKYCKETAKHNSPGGVYNDRLGDLAGISLAQSDYELRYYDDELEGLRDRYSFREGAAFVLMEVFGIDHDYARELMRTHIAWADYEQAKERTK